MTHKYNANYIKTVLIDYLLKRYEIELISLEVPYLFGYRRADLLALINNKTMAFEIKSELDSLAKLEQQVKDYIDVFNEVYIVIAEKFKKSPIVSQIPKKVGIFYFQNNQIILHRKAKTQINLKNNKLIYLFKKDEMNKITPINNHLSLRKTREIFLQKNSSKFISECYKNILRSKYSNQYKRFLDERGTYTIEDDLSLITGIKMNPQILLLS